MTQLFELRWNALLAEPADADRAAQVQELAGWLGGSVGAYLAPNELLVSPLVRASWLGRLNASAADAQPWRQAYSTLGALEDYADPVWLGLQRALALEERPELSDGADARLAAWRELAALLDPKRADHALLSVVCEYFIGYPADEADARRRSDMLRGALRRDFKLAEPHWLADSDADSFAAYCIGLRGQYTDRRQAERWLEEAATGDSAGALTLLKGRAARWLPIAR
jgi:hypothetical protein